MSQLPAMERQGHVRQTRGNTTSNRQKHLGTKVILPQIRIQYIHKNEKGIFPSCLGKDNFGNGTARE